MVKNGLAFEFIVHVMYYMRTIKAAMKKERKKQRERTAILKGNWNVHVTLNIKSTLDTIYRFMWIHCRTRAYIIKYGQLIES